MTDEPVKDLVLSLDETRATLELVKRLPNAKVYGLLLNSDREHPLAKAVADHWSEIHHASGDRVILVAFQPPAQWSDSLKRYWQAQLGDAFKKTWKQWQSPADPSVAFEYVDFFNPPIDVTRLPCLVLFTDPEKRDAVVRSLPDWDPQSLYELLLSMIQEMRDCADEPDETRLECLRKSLTSPSARARDTLGHLKDRAVDYLRKNPAEIVKTTVTVVLALASGGIIPLGHAAMVGLTVVKDVFSKAK